MVLHPDRATSVLSLPSTPEIESPDAFRRELEAEMVGQGASDMRILFMKHSLAWPRSNGHDVHMHYMMKACAELGHEVSIATVVKPEEGALNGLSSIPQFSLNGTNGHHETGSEMASVAGTRLQLRF